MNDTQKAALALCNEIRRQHELPPCEWDEIEHHDQIKYQLQAQAVWLSYYRGA